MIYDYDNLNRKELTTEIEKLQKLQKDIENLISEYNHICFEYFELLVCPEHGLNDNANKLTYYFDSLSFDIGMTSYVLSYTLEHLS